MTIKNILVSLNDVENLDHTLNTACNLALKNGAHLIGVYVVPFFFISSAIHGNEVLMQDLQNKERQKDQREAKEIVQKFEKTLKSHEVLGKARIVNSANTDIAEAFIRQARTADLVVIPKVDADQDCSVESDFAEKIVLSVGRPVLILPRGNTFETIGVRPLIGWNLSAESARASFDSLPLLDPDGELRIVAVDAHLINDSADYLPCVEIAEAFSHYGLDVVTESIQSGKRNIGEALIHDASINGADLMVMGAYGHSRLRELIFGGATRYVLANMSLPVLMSR